MASAQRIHVVVLFGGQSAEHDVSCVTAAHVIKALDSSKYDITAVGITREGKWVVAQPRADVLVAEGEPSRLVALVGEATDLWFAIEQSGSFVLHVLGVGDRQISDRFAGIRPSPGGLFVGLDVEDGPWGPTIRTLGTRAHCRLERSVETGFHQLVTGLIDQIDLEVLDQPLVYYRGRYRMLGDVPEPGSGSNPGRTS